MTKAEKEFASKLARIADAASQAKAKSDRLESSFDKWARWVSLLVGVAGSIVFSIALIFYIEKIARDILDDGIVLTLLYFVLTTLGVLRSFRPRLPLAFHLASALANVLVGPAIIMGWVGAVLQWIQLGSPLPTLAMLVATVLYVIMLRAVRIHEFFRPPSWMMVLSILVAFVSWVLLFNLGYPPPAVVRLGRIAILHPAVVLFAAIALAWMNLLLWGFVRAWPSVRRGAKRLQDSPRKSEFSKKCLQCGKVYRSDAPECPDCQSTAWLRA